MRNTAKVQAVAMAAMIAVAVVAGAGEAKAAKSVAGAAARRAEMNAAYGQTVQRPRILELAGKRLREVLDEYGPGVQLAKARRAVEARIRLHT